MDLTSKEVNEIIDKVCDFLYNKVLRSDIILADSLINDLKKVKKKYPSGSATPHPPLPPNDRVIREDGKGLVKPNYLKK